MFRKAEIPTNPGPRRERATMQMGNQVLHVDIQIEKISKNVLENNLSSKAYIFVEVGLGGATMW